MRLHIKPSRSVSKIALFSLVGMIAFGIGFLLLVGNVLVEEQAPLIAQFGFYLFMAFWLGTAITMAIYHRKNMRNGQGVNLFEVDGISEKTVNTDPGQQLRTLSELKRDGLISEEEFQLKRAEIMAEHW